VSGAAESVQHARRGERGERRRDRSQISLAHLGHLLELAATRARLQVCAQLASTQPPAVLGREATAHRVTRHVAAFRHFVQRRACLVHELFRCCRARGKHRADLLVVEAAELAHHKRCALSVLQRSQVRDELS
jgi:hypothetical protein